jgi:hypothetical protein
MIWLIRQGSSLKSGSYYLKSWTQESLERVFASRIKEVIKEGKARHAGYPSKSDYSGRDRACIFVEGSIAGARWSSTDEWELPKMQYPRTFSNETDLENLKKLDIAERVSNKKESFVDSLTMMIGMVTGEVITKTKEDERWGGIQEVILKVGDKIKVTISVSP